MRRNTQRASQSFWPSILLISLTAIPRARCYAAQPIEIFFEVQHQFGLTPSGDVWLAFGAQVFGGPISGNASWTLVSPDGVIKSYGNAGFSSEGVEEFDNRAELISTLANPWAFSLDTSLGKSSYSITPYFGDVAYPSVNLISPLPGQPLSSFPAFKWTTNDALGAFVTVTNSTSNDTVATASIYARSNNATASQALPSGGYNFSLYVSGPQPTIPLEIQRTSGPDQGAITSSAAQSVIFHNVPFTVTQGLLPLIDQAQEPPKSIGLFTGPTKTRTVAQTFTPKVTGKLDALTLWVDSEGHYDVRVRITETSGGKPDLSRVIAESLVPQPANVPALSTLSFDDQLAMLHQGTLYAFVLSSSDPSIAFADAAFGLVQDTSAYPAGDALYFGQSGTWSSMTSEVPNVPIDFVFRTWMAPVPEPAIGSLLFIASLAICRQRRIAGIL